MIIGCAFISGSYAQLTDAQKSYIEKKVLEAEKAYKAKQEAEKQKQQQTQERHETQKREQTHQFNKKMENLNSISAENFMSGPSNQQQNSVNEQNGYFRATNYADKYGKVKEGNRPVAKRKSNPDTTPNKKDMKNLEKGEVLFMADSGNDYTEGRYKNKGNALKEKEYKAYEEKISIRETNDFVHASKYQKLPSMSSEDFVEYCAKMVQEANHIRKSDPNIKYNLVCSSTVEDGHEVQNVFVEYIAPKHNAADDDNTNKLISDHDQALLTEDLFSKDSEKTEDVLERIQKLQTQMEELEKQKREAEAEALFCEKMLDNLDSYQNEEKYYVTKNLSDLAVRNIPIEAISDFTNKIPYVGDWVKDKVMEKIEDKKDEYFENWKREDNIADEPTNKVAETIENVRSMPQIDDVAKYYLGNWQAWTLANSPEIGKTLGHAGAWVNIYFQKNEWKTKGKDAQQRVSNYQRHLDMYKKAIEKLNNSQ